MNNSNALIGIFAVMCFVFFISCSDDNPAKNNPNEPSGDFKYPYEINSFWYYSTYNYVTNYRPDSLRNIIADDTIVGNGIAEFTRDTVFNSDTLHLLKNTHSSEGHEHTTLELYKQSDTGLVRYAFYSNGTNFGPFRVSQLRFKIENDSKEFKSTTELLRWYESYAVADFHGDTTFIIDDPPINAIKYPITDGTEWSYLDYGATKIKKLYSGFENISTQAGSFYCARIKRNWYLNFSNVPDSNFYLVDYFSESGMVKRDFRIKNVLVTTSTGDPLGYIEVVEESKLNIVTLP
ncbi:MAG: hypothetical protein IPG99_18080 [Ignavibacteria bacterium]|nr:hypothetical protein [Ignavibacteria bacterium]